jgi:hypothetical protein
MFISPNRDRTLTQANSDRFLVLPVSLSEKYGFENHVGSSPLHPIQKAIPYCE